MGGWGSYFPMISWENAYFPNPQRNFRIPILIFLGIFYSKFRIQLDYRAKSLNSALYYSRNLGQILAFSHFWCKNTLAYQAKKHAQFFKNINSLGEPLPSSPTNPGEIPPP